MLRITLMHAFLDNLRSELHWVGVINLGW